MQFHEAPPTLQPVLIKEVVIKTIRDFFYRHEFHEVVTPTFNRALPLEPNIYSFESSWRAGQAETPVYLSVSPESGLKKMLAQGMGNCFALGKCFRNLEGAGSRHNPEFLMLEWYRTDASYQQIMTDTEKLVSEVWRQVCEFTGSTNATLSYQGQTVSLQEPWPRLSLEALFLEYAGLRFVDIMTDEELTKVAAAKGYQTEGATWSQLFDQIFLNEVESHLPASPHFLLDFPARLSPLCKPQTAKPYLAERFETFLFGMELGNGNTEQTDVTAVKQRFAAELAARQKAGQAAPPIDLEFLAALETMSQAPYSFAGIGLGVDRLAMIMANQSTIQAVEPFSLVTTL